MKKRILVLVLPLLALALIFGFQSFVPSAHAVTGLVCLQDPNAGAASPTAPCPTSPPDLNGPAPTAPQTSRTQIRIGVFIQGSDALNGFDIILLSSNVLRAAGVDFTGTVVPGATTVVVECLDGVLVSGPTCVPQDTPPSGKSTLHFALAAGPAAITAPNISGLLFTAVYNITGTTPAAGVSAGFQTGCTVTATSDPPFCVTVTNGSTTPASETLRGASFNNSTPPQWVAITASPLTISFAKGSASLPITITATAENGWPGFSTDTVTFTSQQTTGLTPTFSASSCTTGGTSCTTSVTLAASAAGTYFITVFGNYVFTNTTSGMSAGTLAGSVKIQVSVQDFSIIVSPSTVSFATSSSGTATVTLTSLGGFSGSGTIATAASAPAGLTIAYNTTSVTLTAGGKTFVKITFTSATVNNYLFEVKATFGTLSHTSALVSVHATAPVADFALTQTSSTLSFAVGGSTTDSLSVASLGGFTVTFTTTVTSGGSASSALVASCTSVTLPPSPGTSTCTFSSSTAGSYSVVVMGASGTLSHQVTYSVTVTKASPTISTTLSSTSITAGASVTDSATLTGATSNAGGTVTYQFFSGSTCSGTATTVGTPVTVTAGVVPHSASQIFSTAGSFSWNAVHSGDANNNGATSGCEPLTVSSAADFTLTQTSATITFAAGSTGSDRLTVTATGGFTGTVSFTTTVTSGGSPSTALTASCTSVTLTATTTSAVSTCSFGSSAAGSYSVVVTGTTTGKSQVVTVFATVVAPSQSSDFAISTNPTSLFIQAGSTARVVIVLRSLNGFAGTLNLASNVSPEGPSSSLSRTSIVLTAGGFWALILSVSTTTSTSPGNYTAVVTATSGSISHSVFVPVTVI